MYIYIYIPHWCDMGYCKQACMMAFIVLDLWGSWDHHPKYWLKMKPGTFGKEQCTNSFLSPLARSQHTKGKGCIEKSKTSERSFSQRFTDVPPFLTFQTFWKRLFFYQACVPIATCAMVKHGLWGVVIPPSLGILYVYCSLTPNSSQAARRPSHDRPLVQRLFEASHRRISYDACHGSQYVAVLQNLQMDIPPTQEKHGKTQPD